MIGIDLVKISRITSMIDRFGNKALLRFLNEDEIMLSKDKPNTIASFWAAKEAISKALGVGISKECNFHDIEIKKNIKNAPYFILNQKLISKYKIIDTALSITHDGGFVIAVATLEKGK